MNWRNIFVKEKIFKDQKITVMGLGLLGGVEDIKFLAEQGAELIVTDLKQEEELGESLAKLKRYKNIHYTLGEHSLEDFRNRDLIIKAPATPLDSLFIAEAKKNNIPITMWAALFARYAREKQIPIVGVTGTRGKSTVTALIVDILKSAGKKTITGGNVLGEGILSKLRDISSDTIAVLELDSWKLQGFGEEKISPAIAVFTNFYPDHMDYYGGDMNAYIADKANIFIHQSSEEYLVLGEQVADILREKYRAGINAHTSVIVGSKLPSSWRMFLPGVHNRANAALAMEVAHILGIDEKIVRRAIEAFRGVPGRLEFVREDDGVKIYNDTTATTPDATLAGIRALGQLKKVILIMGGADKGLSYDELFAEIPQYCKTLILLNGSGTERILDVALDIQRVTLLQAEDLQSAVQLAQANAREGDSILFSPAFASFGMFKNEYDRGEQFNALVKREGKINTD
jgi:UDP-N-acetylmuramoylalanine--D-glutamate ligase